MKTIYGQETGRSFRHHHGAYDRAATHEWPDETIYSAGGCAPTGDPGTRPDPWFLEVYPPGASFIRGNGATPEESEDRAWASFQRALHCDGEHEHLWEPRGYTNGAGFCRWCSTFASRVFTGEDLGQFCAVCGDPTTHGTDSDKAPRCELHMPTRAFWWDEDDQDDRTSVIVPALACSRGEMSDVVRASTILPGARVRIDATGQQSASPFSADQLVLDLIEHKATIVKVVGGTEDFRKNLRDAAKEHITEGSWPSLSFDWQDPA